MYYLLTKDRQVVECPGLIEWGMQFDSTSNQVARTVLGNTVVSTVFLGLDHRGWYGEGAPVLFETMIFDKGQPRDYQERYCSFAQAHSGHARAVYHVGELRRKAALSSTSRNAREGRYLVRRATVAYA